MCIHITECMSVLQDLQITVIFVRNSPENGHEHVFYRGLPLGRY